MSLGLVYPISWEIISIELPSIGIEFFLVTENRLHPLIGSTKLQLSRQLTALNLQHWKSSILLLFLYLTSSNRKEFCIGESLDPTLYILYIDLFPFQKTCCGIRGPSSSSVFPVEAEMHRIVGHNLTCAHLRILISTRHNIIAD